MLYLPLMALMLLPCIYLMAYAILCKEDFLKADHKSISFVSHYPFLRRKSGEYQWYEIKYYDASINQTKHDSIYKIQLFGQQDELLNSVSFPLDDYTIEELEAIIDEHIPTKETYLQNNTTASDFVFTRKKSEKILMFIACAFPICLCVFVPYLAFIMVLAPIIIYLIIFYWLAFYDKITISNDNIEIDVHNEFCQHTKRSIPSASVMKYYVSNQITLVLKDNDEMLSFEHLGYRNEIKTALYHILHNPSSENETERQATSASKKNKRKKRKTLNQTVHHDRKDEKKKYLCKNDLLSFHKLKK